MMRDRRRPWAVAKVRWASKRLIRRHISEDFRVEASGKRGKSRIIRRLCGNVARKRNIDNAKEVVPSRGAGRVRLQHLVGYGDG